MNDGKSEDDPIARLWRLRDHEVLRVVGLMSGTSADGIDAVLATLRERKGGGVEAKIRAFHSAPYPRAIAERVLAAGAASTAEITELDAILGTLFGEAVLALLGKAGVPSGEVDLVGSHGQTVCHLPPGGGRLGATLQLGDAARIAEATSLPVVSDFRSRDMAAGGQGAPLVPFVDQQLFAKSGEKRVLLNIGGIANLTALDGREPGLVAFDVGPGNALLDALMRIYTGGEKRYDEGGAMALRGRADEALLADLLLHPFLARPAPKSVDRDEFSDAFARRLMAENAHVPMEDLLATAAAFTADAIAGAIQHLPPRFQPVDRLIASGGGVANAAILARLASWRQRGVFGELETTAAHGVDPAAKEALAFAVLARETLLGRPGNCVDATGAQREVVLGTITP
jgi:anhydro-N-acetylmuramic acid kinase